MWDFLINPKGRVSRKAYWLGYILPFFGLGILSFLVFFLFLTVATGSDLTNISEADIEAAFKASIGLWMAPAILLYFGLIWVSIAVGFKRLHDRNRSGWWMFAPTIMQLIAIPAFGLGSIEQSGIATVVGLVTGGALYLLGVIVSLWLFVSMYFLSGTPGENKYGHNPLDKTE